MECVNLLNLTIEALSAKGVLNRNVCTVKAKLFQVRQL